jgi:hypothetical protein
MKLDARKFVAQFVADGSEYEAIGMTKEEALSNLLKLIEEQVREGVSWEIFIDDKDVISERAAAHLPVSLPDGFGLVNVHMYSDSGSEDNLYAMRYGTYVVTSMHDRHEREHGDVYSKQLKVGPYAIATISLDRERSCGCPYRLPEGSLEAKDGKWVPYQQPEMLCGS